MHSQEADHFIKVIIMRANIKLLDLLPCFHYILNPRGEPPRMRVPKSHELAPLYV